MPVNDPDIKLPGFLIADLYKNCLVEDKSPSPYPVQNNNDKISGKKLLPGIQYLGENNKNISIIVQNDNDVYLPEADLTFLSNILKACGLNISDIAIVNCANQSIDFQALKEKLFAGKILLMGVNPSLIKLPFTIPYFQIQNFDQCVILFSPSLSQMNMDNPESKEFKRKLWESLKKIFVV